MRIPLTFTDLTDALISLTAATQQLNGLNLWRQQQPEGTVSSIDPELAREVPFAPSKHTGNPDSLWAKFHFEIMMQNFHQMKNVASDPELTGWHLSESEACRYFPLSKDLKQHVETGHELTIAIDFLADHLPQTAKELPALMRSIGTSNVVQNKKVAGFFQELADYLPSQPTELFETLAAIGRQNPPELRRHGDFFRSAFDCLPEPSRLGPEFTSLLKAASRQQSDDGLLRAGNDLMGRMLQAFYADKRAVPFEQMGLDARAKDYFKAKGIYERTLNYFQELSNCPIHPGDNGKVGTTSASDILTLYSSWYRKPGTVEMLTPQFTGAAATAADQFRGFLEAVKQKTHGRIDLAGGIEAESFAQMREDDDMLRRIGRMAMIMDAGGNKPGSPLAMDSGVLLKFAKALWPREQREKVWGSPEHYVPGVGRGFESFRQDSATLLYATALNAGNHAASLPGDGSKDAYIATVISLAKRVNDADTMQALTSLMADPANKEAISHVKEDALFLESDPEQFHAPHAASGIHFVSTFFGMEKPNPIPIPLAEILKGFEVLKHDKANGKLLLRYQEAGERMECEVPVTSTASSNITYQEKRLEDADGILYPAYLSVRRNGKSIVVPVVGRTSYDPLGASGSAHAGEVMGFGCSMHHSSLQYALTMAAALGADRKELSGLKDRFMSINPEFHQRESLANFQVEQVASAFESGKPITYRDWIKRNIPEKLLSGTGHEHSRNFLEKGGCTPAYQGALAALGFSYPELYPASFAAARKLSPRASFYDGTDVSIRAQSRFFAAL